MCTQPSDATFLLGGGSGSQQLADNSNAAHAANIGKQLCCIAFSCFYFLFFSIFIDFDLVLCVFCAFFCLVFLYAFLFVLVSFSLSLLACFLLK